MKNIKNKTPSLTKYYLSFIFAAITFAYSFSWAEVESRFVSCDLSGENFGRKKNIKLDLYKDKTVEIDRDRELFPFSFRKVEKINNKCHLLIKSETNVDLFIPLDGKSDVSATVYKFWHFSGSCQVLNKEYKSTGENYVEILREFYGDEVRACNDESQAVLRNNLIPAAADDEKIIRIITWEIISKSRI